MIRATGNTSQLMLLALMASGLLACGAPPTPPEEALRAWVADGQRLVEAQDRSGLMDMISEDYADSRGNDRVAIGNLFRLYFLRAHGIALLTSIEGIRVFDDSAAEIDLKVGMAATHDGTLGFSADAYNFELELVRDGDDWLLISGRWGETGAEIH
jgi:hypothetical protein